MTRRTAPAHRRTTWQRGTILRAIETATCHLTAEEIYRRARRRGRAIGLATVYRSLEAFVREGVVEPAYLGDGRVRYALAVNHHEHLVCLRCGGWESLDACLVPQPPRRTGSGFRVTGHRLTLYGHCARCQAGTA
jgi:Fe2+ or Zn2+ uptake regulation protein